ncbi:MAG TPA: SPOR domain-containing protein [Burkholderiaceae bacterium]|nr:SPOR domain-containing protein [Burkholderiaceae bacterium]
MNATENVFDTPQRGSTLVGFIGGLVLGLAIAVAIALFITNAPVPFINKVRPASENVNPAGSGPLPDPNKPLYTHAPTKAIVPEPSKSDAATDPKAAPPPAEKGNIFPAEDSRFLLQAGAFRTPDDADSMRARLALLGFDARVFPREQDGTTLYRVRLGPYGNLEDVNRIRKTMAENGIDVQLVRLK